MPITFTQANRPLRVDTALGPDVLLLVGLSGFEAISRLFTFHLDLLSEDRTLVKFDKVLGQTVVITILLPSGQPRFFSGICSRISEGARDGDETFTNFTSFRMEVVPLFWLLTRRAQSRIFQHMSVPDILRKVLAGIDVSFEISGTFEPRDYCVQYRETDFNFASRLMEEEGIYYFFKHSAAGHQLVLANTPQGHPNLPINNHIIYEGMIGGNRPEDRVFVWEKTQEIRSGKYTLWDHTFELPHKHLDATEPIVDSIAAGEVTHSFKVGQNDKLEIYDFPGEYAQRFDGVDKGGGEQPAELQKIFQDNKRTTKIRMQQEALHGLTIQGAGDCRQFTSGHKFSLERHFDANGDYILTSVSHSARLLDYRSGSDGSFTYENSFVCIPAALPFRPTRVTPKPSVQGSQTAVVVGPAGEEIFTDKYGRVKVQFHWDRQGKNDADSSCWVRVAQDAAGKKWGAFYLPRIGHEVLVDFLEGDPDQPIIVGAVYNASEMPPYKLPDERTKTVVFKSNTTPGGNGFNEIRIEDKKGKEQIFIHGERDEDVRIKHDRMEWIGNDTHLVVKANQLESVQGDKHQLIKGDHNEKVDATASLTVGADLQEKVANKYALDAGMEIHLKSGMNLVIESGTTLTLKVGGNFININAGGIFIKGTMVMINSAGAAGSGAGSHPGSPKTPKDADDAKSGEKSTAPSAAPVQVSQITAPSALALQQASQSGAPFCDI